MRPGMYLLKMMVTLIVILAAVTFANAKQQMSDDFTSSEQAGWQMIAGKDDPKPGTAQFKDGTISLESSCMQKVKIDSMGSTEFTGQVDFYLAEGDHQAWESAALTLFGESTDARAYFMVIFGQPGRQGEQRHIGIFPDQMLTKDLPDGKWYTIKANMTGGDGKMKVWAKDADEPGAWDIDLSLPGYMEKVSGVGMRTYGPAVRYDNFAFSAKEYDPIDYEQQGLKISLSPSGKISSLTLPSSDNEIQFRPGGYHAGPAWIVGGRTIPLDQKKDAELAFAGKDRDISYSIEYSKDGGKLAIVASLKNNGKDTFKPDAARLMLGLNTEMVRYPDWNDKFFPTLIRGEKTHLWGYFMSPKGRIVTISSPDPIASWNYEYQPRRHRIYTVSLDMLHKRPLPERHPQNLMDLKPGQEKTWTIYLEEVDDVKKVKPVVSRNINAPMIDIDRYTIADGEQSIVSVISTEGINLTVTDPSGKTAHVHAKRGVSPSICQYTLKPKGGIGQYTLRAENKSGKISEASIYVRHPWSWYLTQARKEAIRCPQKAGGCCENWLGHFSNMLAKRYYPDEKLDQLAEENFRTIFPALYDPETGEQFIHPGRIQNSYYMCSLLTDMYRATGNIEDLQQASIIADWLMKFQSPDGAYRNGHTHYTCVAYGAKSMLELAAAEKELAKTSDVWKERYERHYNSAKAAMEELELNLDNIETEGQATYEDGMIGCSATQLAMWAVLQKDPGERAKFLKAAKYMFDGRRCLDQMIVPDSRYHEGSLRFWEAQYDVLIPHNMMNSPHGWTAWRIPGYYYMYQLTGEEEWIRRAMNSLGSCVQLIDGQTGVLHWSFTQDPFIETSVYDNNPDGNVGIYVNQVISEQYLGMISDFHQPRDFSKGLFGYSTEDGSSCDNDVHEIFKALEEVALTAAYVSEREDGTLSAYNCTAKKSWGTINVTPTEDVISRVHLNLMNKHKVKVEFGSGQTVAGSYSGMQWIGPGGVPEDLR